MCNALLLPSFRILASALSSCALMAIIAVPTAAAQTPPQAASAPQAAPRVTGPTVEVASDYVIGSEDVLGIVFWRDTDMTGDVTVRPDGKITLPLIGDMTAVGLTPEALRDQITKAASKLIDDPSVTVVVRAINSRKVFITGQVTAPKDYPLTRELTVMQLISLAGGLTEYADKKNITVLRTENGQPKVFKVNYADLSKGKNLAQNIVLKPGDTVVVP
jgi:polysaccharide export outer membrane protein